MPTREVPPNPEVLRVQVEELLERLMKNRETVRKQQEQTGKDDPVAIVTGRTAIDHADIVELPGEGHIAMTTAPKMFVKEVLRFFLG